MGCSFHWLPSSPSSLLPCLPFSTPPVSHRFEVRYLPFEAAVIGDETFDLVFTSPPFFDLEVYSSGDAAVDDKQSCECESNAAASTGQSLSHVCVPVCPSMFLPHPFLPVIPGARHRQNIQHHGHLAPRVPVCFSEKSMGSPGSRGAHGDLHQ